MKSGSIISYLKWIFILPILLIAFQNCSGKTDSNQEQGGSGGSVLSNSDCKTPENLAGDFNLIGNKGIVSEGQDGWGSYKVSHETDDSVGSFNQYRDQLRNKGWKVISANRVNLLDSTLTEYSLIAFQGSEFITIVTSFSSAAATVGEYNADLEIRYTLTSRDISYLYHLPDDAKVEAVHSNGAFSFDVEFRSSMSKEEFKSIYSDFLISSHPGWNVSPYTSDLYYLNFQENTGVAEESVTILDLESGKISISAQDFYCLKKYY